MTTTVQNLLAQHPDNPVYDTKYHTASNKPWAKGYAPVTKLKIHTRVLRQWVDGYEKRRTVIADFDDALLPEYDDDQLRFGGPTYPQNYRTWRLQSELDGLLWFHSEVSNIVLSAWPKYPNVLQVAHEKSLTEDPISEVVDMGYSIRHNKRRVHLAIGELKRGLLDFDSWQRGKLEKAQLNFSRELRGYAHKYECPQIFCFDHAYFLMLQFRARTVSEIKDADCNVDCWILPRVNTGGTPVRYALYRLLSQGFRRCQGMWAVGNMSLGGLAPHHREFFNGQPVWKIDSKYTAQPLGYSRKVDPSYGAFYWSDTSGHPVMDRWGKTVWDTDGFWEFDEQQQGASQREGEQQQGGQDDVEDEEGLYD